MKPEILDSCSCCLNVDSGRRRVIQRESIMQPILIDRASKKKKELNIATTEKNNIYKMTRKTTPNAFFVSGALVYECILWKIPRKFYGFFIDKIKITWIIGFFFLFTRLVV